ncbi:MAG: 2Fe-2S iron-sulfur cluster binding domain-containing protein, partial [Pseudomonadota bacterium]
AALAANIDAPYNCGEGKCGCCLAMLRSGQVSMEVTRALSKRNRERGKVLACQSIPVTAEPLWLDFDQ